MQRATTLNIEVSEGQARFGDVASATTRSTRQRRLLDNAAAGSDALTLTVNLSVKASSQYIVVGELDDEHGQLVSYARYGAMLNTGTHTVDLVFAGDHLIDGSHMRRR